MDGEVMNHSGTVGEPHRFTIAEYCRMADAGILQEDPRVELIRGLIVCKAPKTPPHAGIVNLLNQMLSPLSGRPPRPVRAEPGPARRPL